MKNLKNTKGLRPEAMERLFGDSPFTFEQDTIVGVNAEEDAGFLFIPLDEVISLEQSLDIDADITEQWGGNGGILKVEVENTEGAETYYLSDFIVVAKNS